MTSKQDTFKDRVRVSEGELRIIVEKIFQKMGVPDEDSSIATDVLISADLRGVESHGVSNMLRKYVRDYKNGKLNPTPNWKTIKDYDSVRSIDGDRGLGLILGPKAMEIAIEKAKKTGIGMVTIKNSGHMGMISYYAMQALKHDMIGSAMTSGRPVVLPTFGSEPRLGTNPIALAAPALTEPPFVFDAATSVVSSNKIGLIERLGSKVPPGWVSDQRGVPVMQEVDLESLGYKKGEHPNLLPLGSTRELGSHKGYGIACIVEILSGILTGGGYCALGNRDDFTHALIAYKIDAFMDANEFKKTMDEWIKILTSTPPATNQQRVLYPGQIESEYENDRRTNGIPLHFEVIQWFKDICQELSIEYTLE